MGTKHSYLTVTDQFCGAGGSSQGVRRFAERSKLGNGIEVKLALNHWKLAIETHATNFPQAAHHCTDIQACNPRSYPSTDILITSPECTNHSVAQGRKQVKAQLDAFAKGTQDPAAERSRATMWDVVRFSEHHRYRIVITENVVDARAWVCWDAWLLAMHNLGYRHQCVFFNSMFAWPTPQSRDRMYVVFWRKGQPRPDLDFRPWAPCPQCGPVQAAQRFKPKASVKAKYGTQYTYGCPTCGTQVMPFYYAAINAIDWSVPAQRIGDRKEPLKERTMQRIAYGLKKYGNRPLSVSTLYGERLACRVKDAAASPLFTQTGNGATAVASPFMVDTKYSHAGEARAKGADAPLRTQAGQDNVGLVLGRVQVPSALMRTPNPGQFTKAVPEGMDTQTSSRPMAFLAKLRGTDATALKGTSIGMDEPMGTLSAGGMHHALVSGAAMGFLQSYYGQATDAGLDEAMGALSTRDRHALVVGPPRVEDLYFRMLKAHEVQAGMAFARDYVVLGNQRDQVKQLGNAVTPPVMEMLVERCVESLM